MPPPAYFGIESSGLNLAVDLLILFVVVLYLALIYWTYADARRRIEDPMLIGCATAAALFPFVGAIVYMILRPPEYLEDVHERELEIQASEARLHQLDEQLCPHCDYRVERDFIRCPSCLRKLKERCANCSRPLDRAWTICPYCEADVPGLSSPRPPRRRRSMATIEAEAQQEDERADALDSAAVGEEPSTAVAAEAPAPAAAPAPASAARSARAPRSERPARPERRPRPTS